MVIGDEPGNQLASRSRSKKMTNQSYDTRLGNLTFTQDFANGYPTKETYEKLFDEMDFQRT